MVLGILLFIHSFWLVFYPVTDLKTLVISSHKYICDNNLYSVHFEYEQHNNKDCLTKMDLHSMRSDGTSDHSSCRVWCNSNDNCEAFTVWSNSCSFKNRSCGNDIKNGSNNMLYIKQGRFKHAS